MDVSSDWGNTANWSTGSIPTTGDTVYILAGSQNITASLDQHLVTLANLVIGVGFTGTIGTTSAYLQIGATTWTVGAPINSGVSSNGSGRIKIDFGTVQYTGTVLATSQGTADPGLEPVRIKGSNASNKLYVISGRVGVGTTLATETATISEADVSGGTLNFGYGVTWATVNVSQGGTFLSQSGGGTTLTTATGSTATVNGSAKVTTVNAGGSTYLNQRPAAGNVVDTLNLFNGGTVDFTGNPGSGTIGTFNFYKGGSYKTSPANPNHITGTITRINGGSLALS